MISAGVQIQGRSTIFSLTSLSHINVGIFSKKKKIATGIERQNKLYEMASKWKRLRFYIHLFIPGVGTNSLNQHHVVMGWIDV